MELIIELIGEEMKDLIAKVEEGQSTENDRINLAVLTHAVNNLKVP